MNLSEVKGYTSTLDLALNYRRSVGLIEIHCGCNDMEDDEWTIDNDYTLKIKYSNINKKTSKKTIYKGEVYTLVKVIESGIYYLVLNKNQV